MKDQAASAIVALPFVSSKTNWDAATTGDYEADCRRGRLFADMAVAAIRESDFEPLLGQIALDQRGRAESVIIGFWQRIAERLA